MQEINLEAGLRSLRESLNKIKSLLAWEQLKQAEVRPNQPPSFQIHDSVETDLRNEYSFFLFISFQMHSILKSNTSLSETERQHIKKELAKTEQQLYGLNLPQRFT